jgi:hypothetical protein
MALHGPEAMTWRFLSHSDVGINKIIVSSIVACLSKVLMSSPELKARGMIGLNYVCNPYGWAGSAERLERIISSRLGVKR